MENQNERDDLLFAQLKKAKRRKRRKVIITVALVLSLVLIAGAGAVVYLRRQVRTQFAQDTAQVQSYAATTGRISSTVSGSGSLSYLDFEDVTVPAGVTVEEVLISRGDILEAGEVIARVDVNSVMTALADTQKTLDDLDDQLSDAGSDAVDSYISASVPGRVKRLFAQKGDAVVDVMMEHGALALLSLDGLMSVTVEADLEQGSSVTVRSEGTAYSGKVESSVSGRSVVTLTDNGPVYGAQAEVLDGSGALLGTGILEIHSPLAVTGYAGTVSWVSASENQQIYSGSYLFSLTDTHYTVNYDNLLRTRSQKEQIMNQLLTLLREGCVTAPISGIVTAVSDTTSSDTLEYTQDGSEFVLVTMAPKEQMSVSLAVDETDILSLKLGQSAQVTVRSIGEDSYTGTVTEISKVGTTMSGVTQYTAVVTLDREEKMLSGMTASVDIQIQGVDGVVLIPVEALHRTRDYAYVYTSYDEELKEYGGMKEVVTGTSNSKYVEIVSGLQEGETVYYTQQESPAFSFGMMPMGSDFGNAGGGNFGGNPGGGFSGSNGGAPSGFGGNRGNSGGGDFGGSSGGPGGNRPGMGG